MAPDASTSESLGIWYGTFDGWKVAPREVEVFQS